MKCNDAQIKLALYAGGDLDKVEVDELNEHLKYCSSCAAEYKQLKSMHENMADLASGDKPDGLPSNFANQVTSRAREEMDQSGRGSLFKRLFVYRPAAAIALAALALIIIALAVGTDLFNGEQEMKGQADNVVQWDNLKTAFNNCLEGPYDLQSWQPPSEPGVFAVVSKENGDSYRIIYLSESSNLSSFASYPWIKQRKHDLVVKAGSEDIYIAVCLMPESTKKSRKSIEEAIQKKYIESSNMKKGV